MNSIFFLNPLSGTSLTLLAGLLAGLLYYYHRSLMRRGVVLKTRLMLIGLRGSLFLLLLVLVADPARYSREQARSDWLGVVIDQSGSMRAPGVNAQRSRIEEVREFLRQPEWQAIGKDCGLKFIGFAESVDEISEPGKISAGAGRSAGLAALNALENRYASDARLTGWLLISDGNLTDGQDSPEHTLEHWRHAVSTVATGPKERVANLRILFPEVREQVYLSEKVPLRAAWQVQGDFSGETVLEVRAGHELIFNRPVDLSAGGVDFVWQPAAEGRIPLTFTLKSKQSEPEVSDNSVTVWTQVSRRKVRVFYAESYYKDRNTFQEALQADGDFEVHFATSLVGFSKAKGVPFIQDPLYGLPADKTKFFDYDVIVLSDVKRSLLSKDQIDWLRSFVAEQGGALIMVGGLDSFGDGGYSGTVIADMLPVEISEEYKKDTFLKARGKSEQPFHIQFAEDALRHPMLRLSNDFAENEALWRDLPLFGGYNYVGRLKPGASLLWRHPADKSQFGPRVIMALQNYGRGRVLAFTSDITFNWGQWFLDWKTPEAGWLYARFWRQALKWLSENRIYGKSVPFEMEREPLLAEEEKNLVVKVRPPLNAGNFACRLELRRENQILQTAEMQDLEADGTFHWRVGKLAEGHYQINAVLSQSGRIPLERQQDFSVHVNRTESDHLEAEPETLRRIAAGTGGGAMTLQEPRELERVIERIKKRHLKQAAEPLWNKTWIYFLILAILCSEWFLRKRKGLEC